MKREQKFAGTNGRIEPARINQKGPGSRMAMVEMAIE